MKKNPKAHTVKRISLLGLTRPTSPLDGLRGGGDSDGKPGDGGGEKTRWLKLKREEVEERGPLSRLWLYDAALRRLMRGVVMTILEWAVLLRSRVGGMAADDSNGALTDEKAKQVRLG